MAGNTGIGHTRWATHGRPSDENAHPHSCGGVAVVHNGIIENHLALKAALQATRARVHLRDRHRGLRPPHRAALDGPARGDLPRRSVAAPGRAGPTRIAVVSDKAPRTIVARQERQPARASGYGEGESFLASDVPAILEHTRLVIYLEEGELAVLTPEGDRHRGRRGAAR